MSRYTTLLILFLGITFNTLAQDPPLETLGITNGSVHMKGTFPYTDFLKKYKGENKLVMHVWYNATGSKVDKADIKEGKDEIYFLYGRNQKTGLSEMEFVIGANAAKAFSKKKLDDLTKVIDFLQFDVFPDQKFNSFMAMEALEKALE